MDGEKEGGNPPPPLPRHFLLLSLLYLHSCCTPHMELLLAVVLVGLVELLRLPEVTVAGCA